ncbi:Stress response NST1-like protein [Melia azedarach]|uniref:Stress response NST1-like protein n=1 Tax=Melia azedarach TaxID=155640 RepID=A0ACC1X6Z9_MELAZ|nr:Stress response NST1-like protein [Melia azedarach]
MDNMACNKVQPVVRKAKKKQVKDELDRIKQAEKKKRRLEKALATSAAIRSELEKKKQKKKEEQQRLDEEGAAIAEAVALQVLCDDPDDSCKVVLNKNAGFNPWDCDENDDFFTSERRVSLPHQDRSKCTLEGIGWLSNNAYGSGCKWDEFGNSDWSFTYGPFGRNMCASYLDDGGWGASEFSAGLIAAEAVSSLQIAEDAQVDTIVLNEMLKSDESWFKVLK